MKNTLKLFFFLIFSTTYAQDCKFEDNATDENGNSITATKPKIITARMNSGDYIFAKGQKIDNKLFLELDIRAPKKFIINSECQIIFHSSDAGDIAINFAEFKIAYYTKVADHSSYWKLKTQVPITVTNAEKLISCNIESVTWNTQNENSIQKKLRKKQRKNLIGLLSCLLDDNTVDPLIREKQVKPETEAISEIETSKKNEKLNNKSEKTTLKEAVKAPIKSTKEKQIENSIVIPKASKND